MAIAYELAFTPCPIKKWVDAVFAFGFAYGTDYELEGIFLYRSS